MKKLGKLLLFGAAIGTAAAAAYHYLQKMDKESTENTDNAEEDDFSAEEEDSYFDDDFDDELDITIFAEEEDSEDEFTDPTPDTDIEDMATTTPSFSPLAETLMQEEDVEEFFNEDEDSEELPEE